MDEFNIELLKKKLKVRIIEDLNDKLNKLDFQPTLKDYLFNLLNNIISIIKIFEQIDSLILKYNLNKDDKIFIKINALKNRIEEYIE